VSKLKQRDGNLLAVTLTTNAGTVRKWHLICITLSQNQLEIATRNMIYETDSRFARTVIGFGIKAISYLEAYSRRKNGTT